MRLWLLAVLALCAPLSAQEDGTSAAPGLAKPGGLLILWASQGPLSYMTLTPGELPSGAVDAGEVKGDSCQHGLSVPVTANFRGTTISGAGGDGGYRKALAAALKARPGLDGIYDVKVDVHLVSILGVYRRTCVEIVGRGFRRP